MNTLPNLRQIIITNKKRRQNLSWPQEALIAERTQQTSLPGSNTTLHNRTCRNIADLCKLPTRSNFCTTFADYWMWFRSSSKSEILHALAPPWKTQQEECQCFDQEAEFLICTARARSQYIPENSWADIIEALRTCSKDISVHTISIQGKNTNCFLPLIELEVCDPYVSLSTKTILANMTKLELCMDRPPYGGGHLLLSKMIPQLRNPTKMLSATSNL